MEERLLLLTKVAAEMVNQQLRQIPALLNTGGGGGGGGGGVQPAKKSEQAIVNQYHPEIQSLKGEAMNYFLGAWIHYHSLSVEEKIDHKSTLHAEAQAKLAGNCIHGYFRGLSTAFRVSLKMVISYRFLI